MRMKATLLAVTVLVALASPGSAGAQTPAPEPTARGAAPGAMMGGGRGARGMMAGGRGGGMTGGGMMADKGCPMMAEHMDAAMGMGPCRMMMVGAEHVEVKNIPGGVTITLTAKDAATAQRLQKMAEAMRLMHDAAAE